MPPKFKEKIVLFFAFCIVFVSLRFAGKIVFPFIIAFILACFVRRIADKVKGFTGLSTRAGGFVCLVIVYFLCVLSLFFILRFIITEIGDFLKILPDIYDKKIVPLLNDIVSKISGPNSQNSKIYEFSKQVSQSLLNFTKSASTKVLSAVAKGVLELPQTLFSIFVCVLASFFICFDYQNIKNTISARLSEKSVRKIKTIKNVIENTVLKMISCYGLLFAITFIQLFAGLALLKIKHVFVLSFFIAIADVFPMIGVGTVLVPWAVVCFVCGRVPLGVGLVSLFLIITLLRNILEPKIIGKKMGIHPLVSLAIVYVGLSLGGFLTVILLLFLITVMKYLNNQIA